LLKAVGRWEVLLWLGLGLIVLGLHVYSLPPRAFLEVLDPKAQLAPLERKERR
jgi:hypothetical protein